MSDLTILKLTELMEREYQAVLEGEYDRLDALTEKKLALIEMLEPEDLSQEQLDDIAQWHERLQDVTMAAIDGISAARNAYEQRLSVRSQLNSYGPNGDARLIETPNSELSRRA